MGYNFDKTAFATGVCARLGDKFSTDIKNALVWQLHDAISDEVMSEISDNWKKSQRLHTKGRKACYFSMEFLVGRAIYNNLLVLGLTDTVDEMLKENGRSLAELEEIEDAALGNGGLGRLAACFLDSAATLNLPLDGYGVRYKYGLFKQSIVDGFQREEADNWTKYGDPLSKRVDADTVTISFADGDVLAVPYDMPIIGCKTNHIGNLRLWQAEPVCDFDFDLFNKQDYQNAVREKTDAENISRVLYPNDDTEAGKILRLKQQYFFCAASLCDLIRKYKATHGDMTKLADFITVQLNDTHPVISIPELMRILCDNEGMSFDEAFEITRKVFNYTNHTVMAEALEKWSANLIKKILPRVYEYIVLINEHFVKDMYNKGIDKKTTEDIKIISDNMVRMANLAIYASSYTNGVARIHTEILKDDVLKDWYKIYPERFQNKTNGITQRRWLALCNKELSALITRLLGNDEWKIDLSQLKKLEKYADDKGVLDEFISIKNSKKKQLADFIKAHDGIEISTDTVFDTQIKRLHEYKRQFLNALSILYIYYGIKDGSIKDFTPTTFLFGAKSAPGYYRAKGIIKLIGEISKLVNSDDATKDLIKVVFVSNYNVSYAEKLVSGSDISEQISTAGTEASGTGNMKLMLNGTVTLGTFDGANVEIVEEAGEENNYIFGARVEELAKIMPEYDPREIVAKNDKIAKVLTTLIDGTLSDGGNGVFEELYFALLDGASWHKPDHYYLLGDLESYVEAKLRANKEYKDKYLFAKKCWLNMCNAGKFSSDRTIADYAENIWKITKVDI